MIVVILLSTVGSFSALSAMQCDLHTLLVLSYMNMWWLYITENLFTCLWWTVYKICFAHCFICFVWYCALKSAPFERLIHSHAVCAFQIYLFHSRQLQHFIQFVIVCCCGGISFNKCSEYIFDERERLQYSVDNSPILNSIEIEKKLFLLRFDPQIPSAMIYNSTNFLLAFFFLLRCIFILILNSQNNSRLRRKIDPRATRFAARHFGENKGEITASDHRSSWFARCR